MSAVPERSHRSALVLSTLLTLVGSCGACSGAQRAGSRPPPSADMIELGDERGAREMREAWAAVQEALVGSPHQRPLGVANLVLSMMLVAGSFMLGARRRATVWFVTNALAANLVFIVADCALALARLHAHTPSLVRKISAAVLAQAPPSPPMSAAEALVQANSAIAGLVLSLVVAALAKLVVHAILLAKVRSAEVAEFIAAAPDE